MMTMRYSQKREIIKEAVVNNRIHPTAEEVYAIVHQTNPEISLGTVYRNLNQLADSGSILRLSVAGGPDRYDGTVKAHQHVCCTDCGKVMDFNFDIQTIESAVWEQTGVRCQDCSIYIKGLCCQCADKIKNQSV